jgi:arylsulfatase A-like enzyme
MPHRSRAILGSALLALAWPAPASSAPAGQRPNVLLIVIDDLNDWVGPLGGHPQASTPHLDRFAASAVTFRNAHCPAPVCNPSRAALMSGLRSSSSGVYSNGDDWRRKPSGAVATLNMHFKANGYDVVGAGKVYHETFGRYGPADWSDYDRPPDEGAGGRRPRKSDRHAPPEGARRGVGKIEFAAVDARDKDFEDHQVVDDCIARLERRHDRPFFLACGILEPHLPWYVPRKYYDRFPLESLRLPRVLETDLDDLPPAARRMALADTDHAAILSAGRWKEAVQGYLAAGAFADAMVGRLLDALRKSAHRDNTIVVVLSDNGWHLGQKQHWRKFTLWEESTRVPLLVSVPGLTRPGSICTRPVDLTSIYPTLCELCGLAIPDHVEGISIKPLLADPGAAWSQPAITTCGYDNHAVRTEDWRYIRYADGSEELYDEVHDPLEWTNLAGRPEHAQLKQQLARWLPAINAPSDLGPTFPPAPAPGGP